jgi:hypothetical protein
MISTRTLINMQLIIIMISSIGLIGINIFMLLLDTLTPLHVLNIMCIGIGILSSFVVVRFLINFAGIEFIINEVKADISRTEAEAEISAEIKRRYKR